MERENLLRPRTAQMHPSPSPPSTTSEEAPADLQAPKSRLHRPSHLLTMSTPIPPGSYTCVPFGGLSLEPESAKLLLPNPEEYHVYKWEINAHRREVRLGINHRGAIWYFQLYDKDTFGHRFYSIVASAWRDEYRDEDDDDWYPWHPQLRRDDLSDEIVNAEREIFLAAVGTLPNLIEQVKTRTSVPIEGAMFMNDLKAGVNGPEAVYRADYLREVIVDQLQTLVEDDYRSVPRIDISAIKGWISKIFSLSMWTCFLKLPSDDGERLYVLKARHLVQIEGIHNWTSGFRKYFDRIGRGELKVLTEMPPHPNVFPAPLALVTVVVDSPDPDKMASSGGQQKTTKLVGWVADYIDEVEKLTGGPLTAAKANRMMGFAVDLCRGAHHLAANGFFHPDLCLRNTLSRIVQDPDSAFAYHRLIVTDFEPIECFQNWDGPVAPEAIGEGRASVDDGGQLHEEHVGERSDKLKATTSADLAHLPEARERRLVFGLGCTLARVLHLRIHISGTNFSDCEPEVADYIVVEPVRPGADPERDAWEELLPVKVRVTVQQCVEHDPRDRPLLVDIVRIMESSYTRVDTGTGPVAVFPPLPRASSLAPL
ncbi:hypothetical protein V8E36_009445 [Tilletia maclaganii]